jgi:hypothetical protein
MTKKKQQLECTGKEDTLEVTTLEQIMGYNSLSRYNTTEASVYEESLKDMNRTDLEEEARSHGVMIGIAAREDVQRLRDSLLKEFNLFISSLHKPRHTTTPIKASKEVDSILREGR